MGSASSKFKKYLQNGDEFAAMQVYQNSPNLRDHLDPSGSYGDTHNQNTPLHYASEHGMKHLLRAFLFEHGGNPNKLNGDNESSMHCVCRLGQVKSLSAEERRMMCISILLMWSQNGDKEKPLLNLQNKEGNTAMHLAAQSGLRKCVEMLISHGADIFIQNKDQLTACDLAVQSGHNDLAAYLERLMVFADSTDTPKGDDQALLHHETEEPESDLYAGLKAQDLQEAKDQLLVETADMLQIPLFTAEALLRDNEWSKALLLEKWMSNAIQCCELAGIAAPHSATQSLSPPSLIRETSESVSSADDTLPPLSSSVSSREIANSSEGEKLLRLNTCGICFGEMLTRDLSAKTPSCGHQFCSFCWESYLRLKIEECGAHHILCPAVNCNILVDVEFIERMVSPEVARKYLQFDIQAFVERNKTIKWCPLPGCGRAVKYPEVEMEVKPPVYLQNSQSIPKTSHAVDCGNGHFFCWECLGEPHSPCGCDQWKRWLEKLAELKPDELKLNSNESEDAANELWLVTNSKPCPNCKSPIQKTEGCNHMKCSKCKFVFCWVCLESWKKHSSTTGGYFRCNRYTAQEKADSEISALISEASAKNQELQELSKFIHYYTLFKRHQDCLKQEEPRLKRVRTKMVLLSKSFTTLDNESKERRTLFVEESLKELVKSRRVMCGSYVYGYYLQDNGYNKALLEVMLKEVEESVEKLAEMVSRDYLVTPRDKIITMTGVVKKVRRNFIRSLHRGLLPPETPSSLIGGRGKMIPTFIGLVPSEELKIEMMGRNLGRTQFWAKDDLAKQYNNISTILNWQDFHSEQDGEEEENSLNQALALTLLGKCSRKSCPKPKARNHRTGAIFGYCSLHCAQLVYHFPENSIPESPLGAWGGCDYSMDLLIALEMSRLQMIEDEARRRKSWLQEKSREHRWSSRSVDCRGEKFPCQTLPRVSSFGNKGDVGDVSSNPSCSFRETLNKAKQNHSCIGTAQQISMTEPIPSCSKTWQLAASGNDGNPTASLPNNAHHLSRSEMAVDNFLKKLSSNEILARNLNVETEKKLQMEKDLLSFAKKPLMNEDGRFRYGELHENGHFFSFLGLADVRRSLKRSQSLGDLTDKSSSDLEWMLDSDHSHDQDFPEAANKLRVSQLLSDQKDSLETEPPSGEDDDSDKCIRKGTDVSRLIKKGEVFPKMTRKGEIESNKNFRKGEMDSLENHKIPLLIGNSSKFICTIGTRNSSSDSGNSSSISKLKENDILIQFDTKTSGSSCCQAQLDFQLIVNDGQNKDEVEISSDEGVVNKSSKKGSDLRIHISSPSHLETQSSNECESETGIPKSPTLYISGVSINRSPEPTSPKLGGKARCSTLNLPICCTPDQRTGACPNSLTSRSRSSSMTTSKTATSTVISDSTRLSTTHDPCIHSSSLSLQSPLVPITPDDLRVSKSASEPEKGRLIFHFPKSPTEGTLSSVLHVKEGTLSSEDFHEALFLTKSPKQSKKKKSKA